MPVTMKQVREALQSDEPDYAAAASMGADALPHLEKLVKDPDPGLASKAASLAGMIDAPGAAAVLAAAAGHTDPRVRVAAAGAARNLAPADASSVLASLLADADVGVQKTAVRSATVVPSTELREPLARLAATTPHGELQDLSRIAMREFGAQTPGASSAGEMPTTSMQDAGGTPSATSTMPSGKMRATDADGDMPRGSM